MSNRWFQTHNSERRYTLLAALPDPPCELCGGALTADRHSSQRCERCGQVPLDDEMREIVAHSRLQSERPERIPHVFTG